MIEISGFAQAHCILGSALAGEGLRSASMAAGSHGRNCDEGATKQGLGFPPPASISFDCTSSSMFSAPKQ